MHTPLFVFEFLGTTELLVIAVVALVLFGPRKLPEIGRTVGKAIGEFKRASEDFKRTWEYEVELERRTPAVEPAPAAGEVAPAEQAAALPAHDADADAGGAAVPQTQPDYAPAPTVARGAGVEDDHAWDVATGRAHSGPAERDEEVNAS
jgi:sec-independent protein translocase protein TatB